MSSAQRRTSIILIGLIGTPVLCLILGIIGESIAGNKLNDDGMDISQILPYLGFILGLAGSITGLVAGFVIGSLTHNKKRDYALYGYLLPPAAIILYILVGIIFY